MADIWMGYSTVKKEIRNKSLALTGSSGLKTSLDDWFSYSLFSNPRALEDSLS
jgi:hypothetical protein